MLPQNTLTTNKLESLTLTDTGVADIPDQETGDDSATSAASASQTKTILPTEVGSRLGKYPSAVLRGIVVLLENLRMPSLTLL